MSEQQPIRKGGPWRPKEDTFTKRKPGEYRPGKTRRDGSKRKGA